MNVPYESDLEQDCQFWDLYVQYSMSVYCVGMLNNTLT